MGRLLLSLVLLLAAAPARPETQLEYAIRAVRTDSSLKVRTQAAIVLGQRGGPGAVAALKEAAARDSAAPVRIAAVGALARLGDPAGRVAVEAARRDPDASVRAAAEAALGAWGGARAAPGAPAPERERGRTGLAFSIEEAGGEGGQEARHALRDALARHLRDRGHAVVSTGGSYVLKPSVVKVDVTSRGGNTVIAVTASLVAVDGNGRMAEMLESGARLKATGEVGGSAVPRYAARALDAAAKTLCDDLAARLR